MAKRKVKKSVQISTQIANFFEQYGAMFDPKSREIVIKRISNLIEANFTEK